MNLKNSLEDVPALVISGTGAVSRRGMRTAGVNLTGVIWLGSALT
ncbi:hypothetical protein DES52_110175 [Deinococcus yavapaiensis KR-236]|uniref:Uncharacterized protein n=1 Tax=Deinococcus yavapaiensis KR-236 TaxID=694435 RepID=A0A318SGT0_9DEIO|nr:hypothetical protein DES52_110175 [Deinococcus yavapaiensis KR-236]